MSVWFPPIEDPFVLFRKFFSKESVSVTTNQIVRISITLKFTHLVVKVMKFPEPEKIKRSKIVFL